MIHPDAVQPKPSEQFSAFLKGRLETLRFVTVAALKAMISQPAPVDLAFLRFAVLDSPTEQFPIAVFALDQSGIEVARENPSYIGRLRDAIQGLPPLVSQQEEDQFVVWETIDEGGPVHALEQPMDGWEEAIFIPWFVDCWRRAGGAAFKCPVTIETHADARTKLR